MKISIVTPAPPHSRKGNRVTAERWARILRGLGHRVTLEQEFSGESSDLMVALHARRSFRSVKRFQEQHPAAPLIVALTGTDLYRDIHHSRRAQESLEKASRLIVLQPLGIAELPQHLRGKARVFYQSVEKPFRVARPTKGVFEIGVLGHLRAEKDPFRAAMAARLLPATSRIAVLHAGRALSEGMARKALAEQRNNPRYRWLGELSRAQALRLLGRWKLLVLSSKMEGGANVLSEALASAVPVLASRIPGSVGILGAGYPGYFPVGDTPALARLMERAEADSGFLRALATRCRELRPLFQPARERASWQRVLEELTGRPERSGKGRGLRTAPRSPSEN